MSDASEPMLPIQLAAGAPMAEYQRYIHELEKMHGWLDVDLVNNCFLFGEEVGELFKAVRRFNKMFEQSGAAPMDRDAAAQAVAEEIVDCLNYLLAIANRLEIPIEPAFRAKNERNQRRRWEGQTAAPAP